MAPQPLSLFRLCRGTPSPFLTATEELVVALSWRDADDLAVVLAALGPADPPRSAPGAPAVIREPGGALVVGAAPDAWSRPAWTHLDGVRCRVEVRADRVEVAISGQERRRTRVVAADLEAAARLEAGVLRPLAGRALEPPRPGGRCGDAPAGPDAPGGTDSARR